MRSEKAIVKLALRANKTKLNTQSIVLRVQWRGKRADKTLPFAVRKVDWNERTNQVRNTCPNAPYINKFLNEEKAKAESVRDTFIAQRKPYSAKDVVNALNYGNSYIDDAKTLKGVMREYTKEMNSSKSTIKIFHAMLKTFFACIGKDDVEINQISLDMVNQWMDTLPLTLQPQTCKRYAEKLHTLCNFAQDKGYTNAIPFSKKGNNTISRRFVSEEKPKPLSLVQTELLYKFWFSTVSEKWETNVLKKPCSKDFVLNFFMCGLNLQGLAPIDMLLLNRDQIVEENSKIIRFKTHRQKTKKEVFVTLYKQRDKIMFNPYLKRLKDGKYFLFPIMDGVNVNDKKEIKRRDDNFVNGALKALKNVWDNYNNWLMQEVDRQEVISVTYKYMGQDKTQTIAKANVKDYLINPNKITLYSYRHTYASMYVASGGSLYQLAKDMGRSLANIGTYIANLQQDDSDEYRYQLLNR